MATQSEPVVCRLLIDPAGEGAWNMAVDESLLESVGETGVPTLRFYSWSQPTLSLGYFQPVQDRNLHTPSLRCPLIRRSTGGGAILHDQELTYSFVWPLADSECRKSPQRELGQRWIYALLHETLLESLAEFGVEARLHLPAGATSLGEQSFLCFQRRGPWDVLVGMEKVAGSAQRRRRAAVLQHGSVLLSKSEFAPELSGLKQLGGGEIAATSLSQHWSERLGARQNLSLEPSPLQDHERIAAGELLRSKFAREAWTLKR